MKVLSLDNVYKIHPAFTQPQPYEGVSNKYVHIPTSQIIEDIMPYGWQPVNTLTKKSRIKDDRFNKHGLKFINPDIKLELDSKDISYAQICLMNSHDASCSFRIYCGFFRLICSNGLIIPISDAVSGVPTRFVSIRHINYNLDHVKQVMNGLLSNFQEASKISTNLLNTTLSKEQIEYFSKISFLRRNQVSEDSFAKYLGTVPQLTVDILNNTKYEQDRGDNAWCVLNRVQHNIINGFSAPNPLKDNKITAYKTIKNFERDINLNVNMVSDLMHLI